MGVFKLQKTKVPTPPEFETVKTIMVIGGGWAGLTAAKQAADYGYDVILVEKDAALGGKALGMLKTAPLEYPYTDAHETGIEKKIADVTGNEKIKVITGARLERLEGLPGQYKATVKGEVFPVGAVVLAAGWVPQNTKVLAPLGYGSVPNVVTAAEFEKMAKEGTLSASALPSC
jgi:quinone-modifying oxidoreductase subunit QmoB